MIAWLKRAIAAVDAVIWPRRVVCLLCDELTDDDYLCPQCEAALDAYRLGEPDGGVCSAYRYKAQAKRLVTALKYDGMADAACVLARAMAEDASKLPLSSDTVVTWAAMPRRRKLVRGIDHGQQLAEEATGGMPAPARKACAHAARPQCAAASGKPEGRFQRGQAHCVCRVNCGRCSHYRCNHACLFRGADGCGSK